MQKNLEKNQKTGETKTKNPLIIYRTFISLIIYLKLNERSNLKMDMTLATFVSGRIGNDLELKQNNNGSFLNFSVAHKDTWKDKNTGEKKEKTTWIPLFADGRTAENICSFFGKGDRIRVVAKYQTYKSKDQNGQEVERHSFKISQFEIIEKKADSHGASAQQQGGFQQPQQGGMQQPQQQGGFQQPQQGGMQQPQQQGGFQQPQQGGMQQPQQQGGFQQPHQGGMQQPQQPAFMQQDEPF